MTIKDESLSLGINNNCKTACMLPLRYYHFHIKPFSAAVFLDNITRKLSTLRHLSKCRNYGLIQYQGFPITLKVRSEGGDG